MEAEFMKAEERERQIRDEGIKEGIKEGMKEYDRFMKLTQKLLSYLPFLNVAISYSLLSA